MACITFGNWDINYVNSRRVPTPIPSPAAPEPEPALADVLYKYEPYHQPYYVAASTTDWPTSTTGTTSTTTGADTKTAATTTTTAAAVAAVKEENAGDRGRRLRLEDAVRRCVEDKAAEAQRMREFPLFGDNERDMIMLCLVYETRREREEMEASGLWAWDEIERIYKRLAHLYSERKAKQVFAALEVEDSLPAEYLNVVKEGGTWPSLEELENLLEVLEDDWNGTSLFRRLGETPEKGKKQSSTGKGGAVQVQVKQDVRRKVQEAVRDQTGVAVSATSQNNGWQRHGEYGTPSPTPSPPTYYQRIAESEDLVLNCTDAYNDKWINAGHYKRYLVEGDGTRISYDPFEGSTPTFDEKVSTLAGGAATENTWDVVDWEPESQGSESSDEDQSEGLWIMPKKSPRRDRRSAWHGNGIWQSI